MSMEGSTDNHTVCIVIFKLQQENDKLKKQLEKRHESLVRNTRVTDEFELQRKHVFGEFTTRCQLDIITLQEMLLKDIHRFDLDDYEAALRRIVHP